ncbi:MAG: GAF domain-containing protein [Acidimicrobiia bacterium]
MRPSQRVDHAEDWPERIRTLLRAALELSGEHDRDSVLQEIVDGAAAVAGARYAALGLYDEGGAITRFVHHGMADKTVASIGRLPEGRGLLGEVIVAEGPIRLEDLSTHPQSSGFPPHHPPMRSFLGVPVVRGGRRYGNLYLTEKHGGAPFDDEDEGLVVTLAAFAAGAIESALLLDAERARTEATAAQVAAEQWARARRHMLADVIDAQEAERARVSRDLHDDIGQALTSVLLGLRLVEGSMAAEPLDTADVRRRLEDLRELAADALRRARQLAFDLRPTVLDDVGLLPALERLAADLAARSGLAVEVVSGLPAEDRLAPEIETVVYRVVQEALTNVVRHAGAGTASVQLVSTERSVRALVEDDGRGFDPSRTEGHLGLVGMAERAELVGGRLDITSAPGEGTTVMVEVPVG